MRFRLLFCLTYFRLKATGAGAIFVPQVCPQH
jgi:hypothetical protein